MLITPGTRALRQSLSSIVITMSTRIISAIAILEGLVLLGLALHEIGRVREECRALKAAQQFSVKLSDQFVNVDPQRSWRPAPDVWETLAENAQRETPWWIVSGVGGALFAAGATGLFRSWKRGPQLHQSSPALDRSVFYLKLFGLGILVVCFRIVLERDSGATTRHLTTQIPDLIARVPGFPGRVAYHFYSGIAEDVSFIRVPYNPASGPWITLENAMAGFAQSNGLTIVRLEGAGSKDAYVCVKHSDAHAMRKFVRSMVQSANKKPSVKL